MKYTLLEVVQRVLSDMDSDEVSSITDTTEALQVARHAESAYLDIATVANIPERYGLFELDASGDPAKPVLMYRPSTVDEILWVKYNKETATQTADDFQYVQYVDPTEFLNRMHSLNPTDSDIDTFDHTLNGSSITFFYQNNKAPDFYTSFDDYMLVFDSFDSGVDTTLQKTKTMCYGTLTASFTMSDSFTPAFDDDYHHLWINETRALAFAITKQTPNQKAERSARRGWIKTIRSKQDVGNSTQVSYPYYGRR